MDRIFEIPLSYTGDLVRKRIELCVEERIPVLLTGDTGLGKTYFLSRLARSYNQELIKINQVGATSDMVLGMMLMENLKTNWRDGLLTYAARQGKWASVEELARLDPQVQGRMFSLLDRDEPCLSLVETGEVVRPDQSFRLFASTNEGRDYFVHGVDKALRDRFFVQEWGLDFWDLSVFESKFGPETAAKITALLNCGIMTLRKAALYLELLEKGLTSKDIWSLLGVSAAMEA